MYDEPLVTVIVTAYNVEKYIKKCVESLLCQSYRYLQILIIDDGSTDCTGKICDTFNDNRITVIHKENEGLVLARKSGINYAKGEYIGFVDGDDFVEPSFVETLVDSIITNAADMVHVGYYEVRYEECIDCGGLFEDVFLIDTDEERIRIIDKYVFSSESDKWISSSIWSKLFKKKIIKESYDKVPNYQFYGEDLLCLINVLMICTKMVVVDKKLYGYRILENSMSHIRNEKLFYNEMSLQNEIGKLGRAYNLSRLNELIYGFLRKRQNSIWNKTATYYMDKLEIVKDKTVIIYGAGRVGIDYFNQMEDACKELIIVDTAYETIKNAGVEVQSPNVIEKYSYDYIIVAVEKEYTFEIIRNGLCNRGISNSKIMWNLPLKR